MNCSYDVPPHAFLVGSTYFYSKLYYCVLFWWPNIITQEIKYQAKTLMLDKYQAKNVSK